MPIQVPVTQTGLEASIETALQRAGRNAKIDIGVSAKSIGSLSQPLGKITGQADQFTRSMEAANARVLAFGASVGVLAAVGKGFQEIITTTIKVEKSLANINSVLGANSSQLNKFKNDIFSVAKETGNSFDTVSEAALELSRQGLKSDEVLRRLKDSMILSRLSGLDAASAVEGLTAAVNSFSKEGVTTSDVLNKISKTAAAYSVSERDLIEGFKRSASVAQQAGVSLDELGGIITAVQQKTARGGATIGNAFKTIFTRIQRPESLEALQAIGAAVTDTQGKLLPATNLIENLAQKIKDLNDIQVANITEKIGGGFQVGPLIAALDDITSKTSTFKGATEAMASANNEAYQRNTVLNQTLAASINNTTVSLQELSNTLGEIGVTDNLKNILSFFGSFINNVKDLLQGESIGSDFAKGLIKGIGAVISGPGLLIFGAIIAKLTYNFIQFGTQALKTFFNIGNAAKEIGAIQSTIASTLLNNKSIQTQILSLEGNRTAQARAFSDALNTQLATMEKMRSIAASIAPAVYTATTGRGTGRPRAAEGYMPTIMAEANDISKGVGGARPSDRPVVIPNFNFGGGKTGTMVANTGENIIKNYGGSGGSAIFNRDMAKGGLPSGAEQIRGARGFIPNFIASIKDAKTENEFISLYSQPRYAKNAAKDAISYKGTIRGIAAAKASEKMGIEKSQKQSGILQLDANDLGGIGIVSVTGAKNGNYTESATYAGLKSAREILDKKFGQGTFDKVTMSNIQVRSLDNIDGSVIKSAKTAQEDFRNQVKQKFTAPLYALAEMLLPKAFSGNDLDTQRKIFQGKADPYMFSDSVLGGIFESAIRVATKNAKDVVSFGASDDSAPFDYTETGALNDSFRTSFKFNSPLSKADAKKTATTGTGNSISSIISKAIRDPFTSSKISKKFTGKLAKGAAQEISGSASGYIPNFADALKDAISREATAGVDISKIYVDQNDSLKNPMNPSGLMVANRRDEPSGGWQGINRARKEGANTKTYGAANGFVPNFARDPLTGKFIKTSTASPSLPSSTLNAQQTMSSGAAIPISQLADSTEEVVKANRDMLGTIFAVQAGLSLLNGATSDAISGFGKFTNAISSVASTATSTLFAAQGLKGLAKEGGAASAVLGKLGVYGAIAAGTFEGLKQVGLYLDSTNSSINKAKGSMDKIADAASKAAINLSNLKPSEKQSIEKSREGLLAGAVKLPSSDTLQTVVDTLLGSDTAKFEGFTSELKDSFSQVIDQALAVGVSYDEMWNMINKKSRSGAIITANEVIKMTKEIEDSINKINKLSPEKIIKEFNLKPTEGLGKQLVESSTEDFQKILNQSRNVKSPMAERGPLAEIQARLFDATMKEDKSRTLFIEQLRANLKNTEETEQASKLVEVGQINLNLIKEQLKSTLDITSARSRINDSLDKQLLSSELLKNLSEKEIRDLKQKIDLRDEDRKLADGTRNLLKDQINKLEGVKGKEKETNELKLEYLKLTDKDFTNQVKVRSLIEGVNKLLIDGVNNTDSARQLIEINLQNLFSTRDIEKDRLEINKQNTEEYNSQKNAIDLIAATMKAASSYKSFSSTMASDIGIQSKNLEVGRLEDSKRGKSEEEIRSIEKTIAARKLEITQLEGSKRTTESITQAKSILEGSLPEAVDKQSRQVFSSLANSVDDAISIATRNLNKAKPEEKAAYTSAIFELQKLKETTEFQNKSAIELAQQQAGMAGQTQAVNDALVLFKNSLEGIPQKLADLSLERGVTTSGGRLREIDYESTTLSEVEKMKANEKTPEEIAAYQRERSVKGVGQKLSEAFSETEYDRANRFSDTLVSGAEKFRDTMIDGMVTAIEQGGNLGDILQSAALDFARELTRTNMKNLFSLFMPSPSLGFNPVKKAAGGPITGGSGSKDDVPAMLMGGEYVMNKKAVQKYGSGFMSALNNGSISGYAKGGSVIRSGGLGSNLTSKDVKSQQTGEGGYYMPGYYDSGAITGKKNLLAYARQAYTSGEKDVISSGAGFSAINLSPESIRLTNFGRKQGPMADATRESKKEAFGLYIQQLAAEKQAKEEEEARKKAFKNSIKMALISVVASSALSAGASVVKSGFNEGLASVGKDAGFFEKLGSGFRGVGEKIGNVGSSLGSLFSGNFKAASEFANMATTNFQSGVGVSKAINGQKNDTLSTFNGGLFAAPNSGISNDPRFIDRDFDNLLPADVPGYSSPLLLPPKSATKPVTKSATGGKIPYASGIDTVPAMLSGGEFIMNAGATQRIGANNLNAMNSGASMNQTSSEGDPKLIAKLDELIKITKDSGKAVTVNVSSSEAKSGTDKQAADNGQQDQNLSRKIKAAVVQVLQEEKRLGGVLRRA